MPGQILLLESDRQLADNFRRFLAIRGYETVVHSDPQSAVMSADKQPPDLAVIDLVLAGRSGIEFLYELRSYPEWQNIPVIALGTLPPNELAAYSVAFKQLNISSYMHKPAATLNKLAVQIEDILQPAEV